MTRTVARSALLLQVVADYTRLSAVQGAGHAGQGWASGPQYPGVSIGCITCEGHSAGYW